ncbi:ECF transporter S component [Orenia metallireducens]|nr:ECF transporter S component [Orenia metallireducens]
MNSTKHLALGGLLIALVAVATMSIKVPMPATGGYIHPGDSIIYLVAILFGGKYALLAGGIGSALADMLSGYGQWAVPTLIIKGIEGYIIAKIASRKLTDIKLRVRDIIAVLVGALWMVGGYYLAEAIMVKSFIVPVANISWNLTQALGGAVIAIPLIFALLKTNIVELSKGK